MIITRPGLQKWLHFLVKKGKLSLEWSAQKEIFKRIHS